MHDPDTLITSFGPFMLWHRDPCNKPGCRDDSCGWFMRAQHGDKSVLEKIEKAIGHDFDRVFNSDSGRVYHTGYFFPNGDPNFSVHGIVLNMFFTAAHTYFGHNWRKSRRWMRKNVADILLFAENPTDSLRDGIVGTFRIACGEKWDRDEALHNYATCIYGWILREQRPWWKHPRWHVHHWRPHVSWWWFVPRFLDRKLRPECYACSVKTVA